MRRALISDIHGNLEALLAVLAHIESQQVDEIVCLGDIIGYGPNPCECLDEVMKRCEGRTILGNHDQAALFDPEGFNPVALQAVYWTREKLETEGSSDAINRRWDFLGSLPRSQTEGQFLFLHGSPREPTNEYVFPEDVYNQRKMDALFDRVEHFCFQGHTHIPGVFTDSRDFIQPEECENRYSLGEEKAMFNVGSVGQPRDNNPDACYVVLDDEDRSVTYHRVKYDIDATAQKIYEIDALDDMLGDRLRTGR